MKIIIKSTTFLVFLHFSISLCFAQDVSNVNGLQTLKELQDSIQKILIATNTPGAGIALVSGDETIWLGGLGKADIENNIDVNENTMFRLGSVSKMFVALAILKLQEEGRLNLKDKIRDLIPDIKIINPWEEQYPIRIENLLEHTSGLSDWSFAELASNDPKPKTLKESLEYYPKGRISKFVSGTRIQYSNLGTSIAAYIVETVSGLPYEDYIKKYFLKPMGMENMTFLYSEQYKKLGAKVYDNGIPLNYLHVIYRPSAALNGSPRDMVNMIKFFINRGKINNTQIISDSSLQRMERKESLHISKSEPFNGYGLSNYASYYKNFVYRGHGGHVPGSNSDFAYLPEYNKGYAIMINEDNEDTVEEIAELIKQYQTKDLPQEIAKSKNITYISTLDLSGYYTIINPKFEVLGFWERIKNVQKIWYKNDTLYKQYPLRQDTSKYYPAENNEFRSETTHRIGLVQVNDPIAGQVIYSDGGIIKKISPLWAYTLLFIFWAFYIIPCTIIIFGVLRILVYLFRKNKDRTALWICLWPLVTSSFLLAIFLSLKIIIRTMFDSFLLLGTANPLSIFIFIGSICFALASLWSVFYIFKNRRVKMSKIFYYHSALSAIINLIFTIYFLGNGVIGIRTWI